MRWDEVSCTGYCKAEDELRPTKTSDVISRRSQILNIFARTTDGDSIWRLQTLYGSHTVWFHLLPPTDPDWNRSGVFLDTLPSFFRFPELFKVSKPTFSPLFTRCWSPRQEKFTVASTLQMDQRESGGFFLFVNFEASDSHVYLLPLSLLPPWTHHVSWQKVVCVFWFTFAPSLGLDSTFIFVFPHMR